MIRPALVSISDFLYVCVETGIGLVFLDLLAWRSICLLSLLSEALTQMPSVVEVWQEDADFFMPSQVCELFKRENDVIRWTFLLQCNFTSLWPESTCKTWCIVMLLHFQRWQKKNLNNFLCSFGFFYMFSVYWFLQCLYGQCDCLFSLVKCVSMWRRELGGIFLLGLLDPERTQYIHFYTVSCFRLK